MVDQRHVPPPPPPPPPPAVDSDAELTDEQKQYVLNALQVMGHWSVHDDGEGRLFYYDSKTNDSQWQVPDPLASLETEFMMKLMLQDAMACSGVWTAHDAGNGTLYYFNSKTRESKWERPADWGLEEQVVLPPTIANSLKRKEAVATKVKKVAEKKEKKVKKKKKHKQESKEKEVELEKKEEETPPGEEEEEEELLTVEELKAEEERKEREMKRIEQFRAMLRDKKIMPLCKWSVALPQIAGDPRFMGIPTMDERRAIFERFVEHRREDLKAEKKSKLKQAKQLFSQFLREQFQRDSWDSSTTLSVFMSTIEDRVEPERYKQVQDNALALLTTSVQEKIYAKAVEEFKVEALKCDGEQLRLTKFFEERLAKLDRSTLKWESDEVQQFAQEFYASAASNGGPTPLLPAERQRQVFDELIAQRRRSRSVKPEENDERPDRSLSRRWSSSRNHESRRQDPSPPRESPHSRHDRRRSRSYSRRRRSRSRSESRGANRDRRSSRRRSVSSSRSRSRSRERSSRRSSRHRRHYSSSRSRSRGR